MAGLPYNDLELLARAIESEAGQEPWEGKMAVGSVIDNRRRSGQWGEGWQDVILAPGQFSAFNNLTGYAGGEGGNDVWKRAPSEASRRAAQAIMAGGYEDPTGGALNYYNPAIADPAWGGDDWQAIGNHVFGTAGGGGGMQSRGRTSDVFHGGGDMSPWEQIIQASQGGGGPGSEGGWKGGLMAALQAFSQNAPRMYRGEGMDFSPWMKDPAAQRQANKTIEWLRAAGRDDLAAAIASGSIGPKDAVALAYQKDAEGKTYRMLSPEEVKSMPGLDPNKAYKMSSDGNIMPVDGGSAVNVNIGDKLTEGQSKSTLFYSMMREAMPIIDKFETQGQNMLQSWLPAFAQSAEYRQFDNAAEQFSEAMLRIATGAVVSPEEATRYRKLWFPIPGDPPEEIARKRAVRQALMEGVGIGAGPGKQLVDEIPDGGLLGKDKVDAITHGGGGATTSTPPPAASGDDPLGLRG